MTHDAQPESAARDGAGRLVPAAMATSEPCRDRRSVVTHGHGASQQGCQPPLGTLCAPALCTSAARMVALILAAMAVLLLRFRNPRPKTRAVAPMSSNSQATTQPEVSEAICVFQCAIHIAWRLLQTCNDCCNILTGF
jgi:hypothetical protein